MSLEVDDDEQQDWRFLTSLKRGEKDFEPDGTAGQQNVLADSRAAMYQSLDADRKHSAKNAVVATWYDELKQAKVESARGPYFGTIGTSDSTGSVWLMPEEVIYLVERGSMECYFRQGLPMSLQAVYGACATEDDAIERYLVFSYLKKLGFIVRRPPALEVPEPRGTCPVTALAGFFVRPLSAIFGLTAAVASVGLPSGLAGRFSRNSATGAPSFPPLRSFPAAFQHLEVIPHHQPPHYRDEPVPVTEESPYKIAFEVWKPTPNFKKSNPPDPDYRLAIVSARDFSMPTFHETTRLLDSTPVDTVNASRTQTQRLKEGWRQVLLAVVDSGVTTFIKVSDVSFGEEKVYKKPPPPKKRPS